MASDDDRQVAKFTRRETPLQRTRRIARKRVDPETAAAIRAGVPREVIEEVTHRYRASIAATRRTLAGLPPRHVHRPPVRQVHVAFILTTCRDAPVDVVRLAVQTMLLDVGASRRAIESVTVTCLPAPAPVPTPPLPTPA